MGRQTKMVHRSKMKSTMLELEVFRVAQTRRQAQTTSRRMEYDMVQDVSLKFCLNPQFEL